MTVLDTTCPFQTEEGRCGKSVAVFDKEGTIAICPAKHQSSIDHLPPLPGPKATPLKWRHRIPYRIGPKDAAVTTALAALLIDSISRHL